MNEIELNEKLAKWAGFSRSPHFNWQKGKADPDWWGFHTIGDYLPTPQPPNFTHSLDACFKWLVPTLNKTGLYVTVQQSLSENHAYTVALWDENGQIRFAEDGETAQRALCLAIEKLIDADAKVPTKVEVK